METKNSSKGLKRLESRKSHSWWWDSHISPKNSKWLQENLENMDQSIKRMLKLIEEDGDSFAKKAEMYYEKRPEMIHLVEDFYRMYRSLAERYDNVTGELRKNIPSDLQSQGSGVSSAGSDLPSPRRGPRPAGFEFFLGAGGSPESSALDYEGEEESDDSSSINGGDHDFCKEDPPEAEVVDPAEFGKIRTLEDEMRVVKEKLNVSEEEMGRLRNEIERNESVVKELRKDVSVWKEKFEKERKEVSKLHDRVARYKTNLSERDQEIRGLRESISNSNKALSEENAQLQEEITKLVKERAFLEDTAKEMDVRCQSLEEEAKRAVAAKSEAEALLGSEIDRLKSTVDERNGCVEDLERMNGELNDEIEEMKMHLHDLHVEHVQLIAEANGAHKLAEELRSTIKGMEIEIKRQQETIEEGAEEKREAIRQLCFSLEHYRNGYHRLRQVFMGGNKGLPVMAS